MSGFLLGLVVGVLVGMVGATLFVLHDHEQNVHWKIWADGAMTMQNKIAQTYPVCAKRLPPIPDGREAFLDQFSLGKCK